MYVISLNRRFVSGALADFKLYVIALIRRVASGALADFKLFPVAFTVCVISDCRSKVRKFESQLSHITSRD